MSWPTKIALCITLLFTASIHATPSDAPSPKQTIRPFFYLPFQLGASSTPDAPASKAPFQLTPKQQAYVDQVLLAWEKKRDQVNSFKTSFTLRTYGSVFQSGKSPTVQLGYLAFQKPNQAFFEIVGDKPEKWTCNGTAIYHYCYELSELHQYTLPADQQDQPIQRGPVPFLFESTKASDLKQRYWIRAMPSPKKDSGQIWLQIFPRYSQDAALFTRAEIIVSAKTIHPIGIMVHIPNGKERHSWSFGKFTLNCDQDPLFHPATSFTPQLPHRWKKVVETTATTQAAPPSTSRR